MTFTLVHVADQPGGDRFRVHRCLWAPDRQTARRMDRNLPDDHDPNQPDWVPLSHHAPHAGPHCWSDFAGDAGDRAGSALRTSHGGFLALDLCRHRHDCTVSGDVFVAVVQSFMKIPPVHALAPTQKEPPFLVVQLTVMAAIFVALGVFAVKRFHPNQAAPSAAWKSTKVS